MTTNWDESDERPLVGPFRGGQVHVCTCGCNRPSTPAPRTRAERGWIKGQIRARLPRHVHPAPVRVPGTGCLIWQGPTDPSGYPRLAQHRVYLDIYTAQHGPMPAGYETKWTCGTRACVEPSHITCETAAEKRRSRRTVCDEGHPLIPGNLVKLRTRPGTKVCRTCTNTKSRGGRPATPPKEGPTSIYLAYDVNGAILYVGVTNRWRRRAREHEARSPWWFAAASLQLHHYPDRASALAVEAYLVALLDPPHNAPVVGDVELGQRLWEAR